METEIKEEEKNKEQEAGERGRRLRSKRRKRTRCSSRRTESRRTTTTIVRMNPREQVHSITAILDAFLPVFHEVAQGEQRIIAYGDPVFRRPCFHGHQDDAGVELLLVDLDTSKRKNVKQPLFSR